MPVGPFSPATAANTMAQARDALIQEVANFAQAIALSGKPKPTYDLDGQGVDWNTYLTARTQQIKDMTALLQTLEEPWTIQSRAVL